MEASCVAMGYDFRVPGRGDVVLFGHEHLFGFTLRQRPPMSASFTPPVHESDDGLCDSPKFIIYIHGGGGVRKWISTIRRKLSPFPWIPDQCLSWGLGHVGCWPQLRCKGMASQFSSWSTRRFLVCWTSEVHYPPDQPPHNVAFRDPTTPLCAEQSNFSRICLLQPSLYNFSCRGSYPAGGLYDSWCLNVCFECNLAFRLNAGKLSRRSSFLKGIFVSDEHPPFQMLPQQVFLDE